MHQSTVMKKHQNDAISKLTPPKYQANFYHRTASILIFDGKKKEDFLERL